MVEWPAKIDLQRTGRAGCRCRDGPCAGINEAALVVAHVVSAPCGSLQACAARVTESVADHDVERLSGPQRVADLTVGGQASLDPGRVEQHGESSAGCVPQFVFRW